VACRKEYEFIEVYRAKWLDSKILRPKTGQEKPPGMRKDTLPFGRQGQLDDATWITQRVPLLARHHPGRLSPLFVAHADKSLYCRKCSPGSGDGHTWCDHRGATRPVLCAIFVLGIILSWPGSAQFVLCDRRISRPSAEIVLRERLCGKRFFLLRHFRRKTRDNEL